MSTQNSYPQYKSLGARDLSAAASNALLTVTVAQIVLNSFIFAAKGPERQLCNATDFKEFYGDDTFDDTKPYYNHGTRFMSKYGSFGGTVLVNRLEPTDALNEANAIVYFDFVEIDIPNYVRDSKGRYVPNSNGPGYKVDPDTPTIKGCDLKVIQDYTTGVGRAPALGSYTDIVSGSMTGDSGETSKLYPIIQSNALGKGANGNLRGFGLTKISDALVDRDIIAETGALPYNLALFRKQNEKSTPKILETNLQDKRVVCTLKPNTVNPSTKGKLAFEDVLRNNWFNDDPEQGAIRPSDYEGIHIYRENLEFILNKIKSYEAVYVSNEQKTWDDGEIASTMDWFDYTNADLEGEEYLIDVLSGKSTKNAPYFTLRKNTSSDNLPKSTMKVINISENTPIMLQGGGDGTMDDAMFNKLVAEKLDLYGDKESYLNDCIVSPETMFVDSGFDVEVKEKAFKFITNRKDTCILLSTYEYDKAVRGIPLSNSDELAMTRRLRTTADLTPESIFYGTYCARAAIVNGGGQLKGGSTEFIPNTFEIMSYMSEYMGASNGKWVNGKNFDSSCYCRELINTHPVRLGDTAKAALWEAGSIYPIPSNRQKPKFMGLQTVFPDSTSVMNNIFTMVALGTCERIAKNSWSELGGDLKNPPSVFIQIASDNLKDKHEGIFDDMFLSIPVPTLTERDKINGNSWRVVSELQGNVGMNECTHSTDVRRREV